MRMVRKQLYLGVDQEQKVRRIAARRGCTEAEVIRTAVDRLPEDDDPILQRLAEAGMLMPSPEEDDPMTEAEEEALEREVEAWLEAQPEPLGLSEAMLEDRR